MKFEQPRFYKPGLSRVSVIPVFMLLLTIAGNALAMEKSPVNKDNNANAAESYAEKGLDAYTAYLWSLIDSGASREVADLAMKAMAASNGEPAELRMELLAITTLGLSRWDFDEAQYLQSGLRERAIALGGDPVIGRGVSEIVTLYDLTRRILSPHDADLSAQGPECALASFCQQLQPRHFGWWSGLESHARDPRRGVWPVDGFRALIRSLGDRMLEAARANTGQRSLSTEYQRFAESYFNLAANLQANVIDPVAVRDLVLLKLETGEVPGVEQVRAQYERRLVAAKYSSLEAEGAFDYHKTLAEYYARLNTQGDASAAKSAVYQLQQAHLKSDLLNACAGANDGEVTNQYCFNQGLQEMLSRVCEAAGTCRQAPPPPPPPGDSQYIGDDIRLSFGYDSETDLTGEFSWNFHEDAVSVYNAEGWKGDDSSGGLKLNFHWLADAVTTAEDEAGNPIYTDGKVRKLFIAADQNMFSDGKMSFGGGSEHEDRFWSLYASKSVTGKRYLGQDVDIQTMVEQGFIDNHAYTQTDTWTTTTDFFTHPYDWGIGFRVGRYFENSLLRLRGGFDYEDGKFSSSQLTGYASVDKRFNNSSQGLSLRAEIVRKRGDFEIDKNDLRLSAYWSWDFGQTFRSAAVFAMPVERIPDLAGLPREKVAGIVSDPVNLQFDDTTSFELDKHELTDAARMALESQIVKLGTASGKILVTGHTCSLGTDEYNQKLSEKRAEAVAAFLVERNIDAAVLCKVGRGETEPKYSNATEESRKKNRRVEIFFVTEQMVEYENIIGEGQPVVDWVQAEAPVEAAWIRRALRNPVSHKRTVDYYRYNTVAEQYTSERELINEGAAAVDDMYSVDQDSTHNTLSVLDNDSDPENDHLKIVSVTQAAHGTVTINGGSVLYTPNPGFYGADSFSYSIEDIFVTEAHPPGPVSTAQVSINVIPINEPPVAADDAYEVLKNSSDNPFTVLVNDSDPDGDVLTIISTGTPANGTVTFTGGSILYTPNEGYYGEDRFDYTITDGKGGEATAWVTVTIVSLPPVAVDDRGKVWKNTSVVIDVLANDFDPDGDPLTIVAIIQNEHPMGTVIDNGDGTLTYTPMRGWWGGDSFQYTISDGEQTSTATVTLKVINNVWD